MELGFRSSQTARLSNDAEYPHQPKISFGYAGNLFVHPDVHVAQTTTMVSQIAIAATSPQPITC
ncbi:hypothetical protein [Bosea psychrotolerans]|uniref:hypothetical protein n=1 Tax=Bosea psychrotolerans TaxID=1871628 RepID=UPI001FE6A251|nr:hypothetical protein [Bosea psychrotolerans]